jgi:hypothetical protein
MLYAMPRYAARCVAAPLAAAMILCAAPLGAQEKAARAKQQDNGS